MIFMNSKDKKKILQTFKKKKVEGKEYHKGAAMNLATDFWLASEEVRKSWRNNQNILREKDLQIFPSWIAIQVWKQKEDNFEHASNLEILSPTDPSEKYYPK